MEDTQPALTASLTPAKSTGAIPGLSAGGLPKRYYLAMASVSLLDLSMNGVYFLLADRLEQMFIVLPENILFLVVINALVAVRIYSPIAKFIDTRSNLAEARKRLATLPLRSAVWVAILTVVYSGVLFVSGTFTPDPDLLSQLPDWKLALAFVWFIFVYAVYYGFYCYFLIDNLAMDQRASLSRDFGLEIKPRGRRFRGKIIFTFFAVALVPTCHLILDLLVFRDLRLAQGFDVTRTVLLDLFATVVILCSAAILVVKGLLRPVRELTTAVVDIDRGKLDRRVAVISDDEFGVLMDAMNKMMDGQRERAFIRETFGRYVPKAVAADIIAGRAPIEPKITTATILFSDIEDFTAMSEQLDPAKLVKVLNEYFSAVIEPVQRYQGVVNQFQGDGMLVTFNVPVPDTGHADHAVATALEILGTVKSRLFGGIRLRTRIGINTGLVFAGNVGSGDRFNYTVHGDAVNVASRLEALNKDLGSQLLVSSTTQELLTETYPLSKKRTVSVKGKENTIGVYAYGED